MTHDDKPSCVVVKLVHVVIICRFDMIKPVMHDEKPSCAVAKLAGGVAIWIRQVNIFASLTIIVHCVVAKSPSGNGFWQKKNVKVLE
jgi:hypothetical protein